MRVLMSAREQSDQMSTGTPSEHLAMQEIIDVLSDVPLVGESIAFREADDGTVEL